MCWLCSPSDSFILFQPQFYCACISTFSTIATSLLLLLVIFSKLCVGHALALCCGVRGTTLFNQKNDNFSLCLSHQNLSSIKLWAIFLSHRHLKIGLQCNIFSHQIIHFNIQLQNTHIYWLLTMGQVVSKMQ